MMHIRRMFGTFSSKSGIKASLVVVALSVSAAVACSGNDPTPSATAVPATAATNGAGDGAVVMLQLPNIADTVERVRPAVVSIVVQIIIITE